MKVLKAAVLFFIAGSLVFLMQANFELPGNAWETAYFIWAKGKDVLFFGAILLLLNKKDKWIIKPLFIYSLTNLLWEVIRPMTDLEVNHPKMVAILFAILQTGVIVLLIKDLKSLTRRSL